MRALTCVVMAVAIVAPFVAVSVSRAMRHIKHVSRKGDKDTGGSRYRRKGFVASSRSIVVAGP